MTITLSIQYGPFTSSYIMCGTYGYWGFGGKFINLYESRIQDYVNYIVDSTENNIKVKRKLRCEDNNVIDTDAT